jgi:hypothetical protein
MNIEYTVIYPAVDHDNPNGDMYITSVGKQRSFKHKCPRGKNNFDTLETIFAGMNSGSSCEFDWFLGATVRSMSVGDVVAIYHPRSLGAEWYICAPSGWLCVHPTMVDSWLTFVRKFGCCSFELLQWKKAALASGLSHIKF